MEIKIIIVDDDKNNAVELKEIVENYNSNFKSQEIVYKVKEPFTEIYAFDNAKEYLVYSQNEIDILLIDYNLKRGLGTDLFKLIRDEFRIYKILHSETDESLRKSKDSLIRNMYNDFCRSKSRETIHEAFLKYEIEILSLKLFGNPEFRDKYFLSENRLFSVASEKVHENVKVIDILYILSEGKDVYKIFFRNNDLGHISYFLKTKFQTAQVLDTNLYFRRVNSQTIINLLWVADIDTNSCVISFIPFNNEVHKIKYSYTNTFELQIAPSLEKIRQSMPDFFLD